MSQLRERWEGVTLPGDYLLEKWLSGDDAAGFFETPVAADGCRAVVKIVPESAVAAAAQLALWRRTRQLRHPNLLEMLDCGRAELAGEVVLYAAFEYADETLASAIDQSPLSEAEAREVLDAVVGALGYLDAQGLGHPALDPVHVLGVRDQIKLSTDALREAAADKPYTDELRAFWYKISPCTLARSADILAHALGEIPPIADVPVRPATPEAAPRAPTAPGATPAPSNRFPKWILVGAAGVVLLVLGLNLRRAPETPAPPAPTASVAPAVPKASPAADAVSKPAPLKSKPAPPDKGKWRVIVFTFRTHAAATAKAEQINKRDPELEATVLPSPKKGNYRIALGGPMSREAAERMQKKARAARVARDVSLQSLD